MGPAWRRLLDAAGSLRLTVFLLAASVPLILAATLDQVDYGLPATQAKYFRSVIAPWHYPAGWPGGSWLHKLALPVPGGLLLGPLFVLNLIAAPLRRGTPQLRSFALALVHGGLLILLLGQAATDFLQRDGYVWFEIGEKRDYVTSFTRDELYLIDKTDADRDRVIAIDFAALLHAGEMGVALDDIGLHITPRILARHAMLQAPAPGSPALPIASRGLGRERGFQILPAPVPTSMDERAIPAAVVELTAGSQSLGTWLVSSALDERFPPQTFEHNGRTWGIGLRAARSPLPFSLTLTDFQHDRYPGTNIPRNFTSRIHLVDPARGEDREVEIRMNRPLRHGGYSFYQSAFGADASGRPDRASRLHVVRNPSRLVPYVACTLITLGLLWHLGLALIRARSKANTSAVCCCSGTTAEASDTQTPNDTKVTHADEAATTAAAGRHGRLSAAAPLLAALALVALFAIPFLRPERPSEGPDPARLTGLPVLDGGRIKPLETVARATLLRTRGRSTALDADGRTISAATWLADLLFDPARAAHHRIYRVDDPDLLSLLGGGERNVAHFSFAELRPHLADLESQRRLIPEDASRQTRYQRALLRLHQSLLEVQRIGDTLPPPSTDGSLEARLAALAATAAEAAEAASAGDAAGSEDPFLQRMAEQMASSLPPLVIPRAGAGWVSAGDAILTALRRGNGDPLLPAYARLGEAWRARDASVFEAAADAISGLIAARLPDSTARIRAEQWFQRHSPFAFGIRLYVLAFLAAAASWAAPRIANGLRSTAWWLLLVAWLVHGVGIVARIVFSGYAPVTNLYSSAVFVGWATVALALPVGRRQGQGLPTAVAGLAGFASLIIAHQLAVLGGSDTLEMMRAVLDSNFWLSTHVVAISLGYSATFLAGFLGAAGILIALVRRTAPDAGLARLVLGITAFALLFSFVGTVLGGIWADQSWGRFWGWDPKENGALLVVVWNAILIHARANPRSLLQLAVGGNIITAWSWFGTNMLGVGLHAYGFMDRAFPVLLAFWAANLAVIAAGASRPPPRQITAPSRGRCRPAPRS